MYLHFNAIQFNFTWCLSQQSHPKMFYMGVVQTQFAVLINACVGSDGGVSAFAIWVM